MNQGYLEPKFIRDFHRAFTGKAAAKEDDNSHSISVVSENGEGIVVTSPFHTGKLRNIMPNEFLEGLRAELGELNWHERSNDLYWFYQTDDLALNGKPHVKSLRDYLAGEEFVGFMEKITGVELTRGYLDLAAQRYKKGNHLLCHDDDVHRGKLARKIAYIIYLVDENWSSDDGGALGLFESDAQMWPIKVVSHIVPEFNSIGFFLTGHASYHTVEEVTVEDPARERWSVTGWFYGPVASDPTDLGQDSQELAKWINSDYTSTKVLDKIQEAFLNESSVELRDFLRIDIYDKCLKEFSSEFWSRAVLLGPAHIYRYLRACVSEKDAPTLYALLSFLQSPTFARFMHSITSLKFKGMSQEIRRFEHGHYTLIHDQVVEPFGVDAIMSLTPKQSTDHDVQWQESWGGSTHYIAEKDELLRISPEPNSFSLVLRDEEGTLRFVKYLNHMAGGIRQEISMVFVEDPQDDKDEDEDE
ncbi:Oxoglutarate and iron-dependent oxygenase degradation C-term-domain-containing protein [Coemansia spiralis]|nr:Oxoglutarate and iron-dependent oxygenase degradation C-term-domain-containing protein [Coemansia spiralis]